MSRAIQRLVNVHRPDAKVSVILIDWNVRESFHSLHYLNRQTVPRDKYELIWVEFYDHQPAALSQAVFHDAHRTPALDQWIVLGHDHDVYFHKHFCYNVGIAVAKGKICVICDSDAIFTPTFIENIRRAFAETPNAVVHLDEVRNHSHRYYPFNYPNISELLVGGEVENWNGETTTGLDGGDDMIHRANYGACLCARRDDLIRIGGADEHIDYVGYFCGPYDMTFRLVNAGHPERWLRNEFLYHTFHPGESGKNFDYQGPSDGKNMSLRALSARATGQVEPGLENPAIRRLRSPPAPSDEELLAIFEQHDVTRWTEVGRSVRPNGQAFLVEKNYLGWSIYCQAGRWYARRADQHPVRIGRIFRRRTVTADSQEELRAKIIGRLRRTSGFARRAARGALRRTARMARAVARWNRSSAASTSETPRGEPALVAEAYHCHNIVYFQGRYFGVPQAWGPTDLRFASFEIARRIPSGNSLPDVARAIRATRTLKERIGFRARAALRALRR